MSYVQSEFPVNYDNISSNQMDVDDKSTVGEQNPNDCNPKQLKKKQRGRRRKRIGISETKMIIFNIKQLNLQLKEISSALNQSDDENWGSKLDKCKEIKIEIEKLFDTLKSAEAICSLKKLIERRRRRRQREKLIKLKWNESKMLNNENRSQLHVKIDTWIRDKQNDIEREKQEESFRKDADIILSDILSKRNDARKYLNVLKELQNLRKVKANNARARGEKLSAEADKSFENIITQLTDQWSQLDHEYSIEEQGLKLMLKTDNEKTIAKQKKISFDDWEMILFGRKLPSTQSIQMDIDKFIKMRFAWDKYVNFNNEGTRIPIGWILPDSPSSAAWQRCLK